MKNAKHIVMGADATALAVLVVALVIPTVACGAPVQWRAEDGGNGHYYEAALCPGGITWTDANHDAVAAGGYLACITSQAENNFVFQLVTDSNYWAPYAPWSVTGGPWLGGFRTVAYSDPNVGWTWVTGEPWTYTNWFPGEPSVPSENYLHFFNKGSLSPSSGWNNATNDTYVDIVSYVIEYNVPEPASLSLLAFGSLAFLRKRRSLNK